jgi:hypothetical protein
MSKRATNRARELAHVFDQTGTVGGPIQLQLLSFLPDRCERDRIGVVPGCSAEEARESDLRLVPTQATCSSDRREWCGSRSGECAGDLGE